MTRTTATYRTMVRNVIADISGKSFPCTAWTATLPNPGHENTISMTVVPFMNPISTNPDTVKGGIKAFLNACFHMTLVISTPFALENLTYSDSSTSSIAERVSRRYAAAGNHPKVTAGRM